MPKTHALNVQDVMQFGVIVFSHILKLEETPSEATVQVVRELEGIYGRLLNSIKLNNCSSGKLEVLELTPETVIIFELFRKWAEITFYHQMHQIEKRTNSNLH